MLAPANLEERRGATHALELVAAALADPQCGFERGAYLSLAQIVAKMPDSDRSIFGTPDHYARVVNKALDAAGRRPGENPFTMPTDHGLLTVSVKRGKAGIQFRLMPVE